MVQSSITNGDGHYKRGMSNTAKAKKKVRDDNSVLLITRNVYTDLTQGVQRKPRERKPR
jgi:hypothetical protein